MSNLIKPEIKGSLIKVILKMDRPVKPGDIFEGILLRNPTGDLWWANVVGTDHQVIVSAANWPYS